MFVYKLKNGKELCRSESKVEFTDLFPQFKDIEPEEVKPSKKTGSKESK